MFHIEKVLRDIFYSAEILYFFGIKCSELPGELWWVLGLIKRKKKKKKTAQYN